MRQAWQEIGSLLLWLVSTALMAPTLIIGRGFLMRVVGAMSGGAWSIWVMSAIDQFGVLILSLLGMLLVLFLAYYYHEGAKRRALWRRFGIVSGAQLGLMALAYLLA
jgi:hypothetical protein